MTINKTAMKIEHFAINVPQPVEMAEWYCRNLGMTVVSKEDKGAFTHFLADNSGRVMIEIYCNPNNEVPDYKNMNALILHLAFVSTNPEEDRKRLEAAGATFDSEFRLNNGTLLIMLRDPWGIAIQLCKRSKKLLTEKELSNS
jgi:catechol-2,3-dioxygenase